MALKLKGSLLLKKQKIGLLSKKFAKTIELPPGSWVNQTATITTSGANWGYSTHDDTANEYITVTTRIPEDYGGGEIYAVLYWTTNTTSGNCFWRIAYNTKKKGEDKDATGFSSGTLGIDSAPGTADFIKIKKILVNYVTQIEIEAGDIIAFQVGRYASHALDTMTGDAKLLHFALEYN